MLGAAYCHQQKKHVSVDILIHYLSPKWQKVISVFAELVVLFVTVTLLYISIPNAWHATMIGERSVHQTPFNPPVWWFRWIIPLSSALISVQALLNMIAVIRKKTDSSLAR